VELQQQMEEMVEIQFFPLKPQLQEVEEEEEVFPVEQVVLLEEVVQERIHAQLHLTPHKVLLVVVVSQVVLVGILAQVVVVKVQWEKILKAQPTPVMVVMD